MANTINLYETREMIDAIEQFMPARNFLRDTFFPRFETRVTEHIDFDYRKGKRKMAPFVAPRVGGITMDREGFVTKTLSVPRIAPQRIMTVDDLTKRGFGEAVYSNRTPQERASGLLAKDLVELDEYITRREEWMCREIILTGKCAINGYIGEADKYIEQEVNYGFTNAITLSGTDLWNTSTADIYGKLKEWRLKIIKATGKAPNTVVMASNVVDAFLKNEAIQKIYDLRRIDLGTIQPRLVNDAITYVTSIPSLGLEVYSYDEWFIADDETETAMIPDGKVIMASTNLGKRVYGSITQIENGGFATYEGQRVPKNWVDTNSECAMLRISTRPLPVPDDIDSWIVATVL